MAEGDANHFEDKRTRLAQDTLLRMARAGLLSYPRPRFRSTGPTVDQLIQRDERIDVLTGRRVAEIEKKRCAAFGDRETVEISVPDRAYMD